MLRRVALARNDISEERNASIIRMTRTGELGMLVTANVVPTSPILITLMMKAIGSFETSFITGVTWRNIPEDGIRQKSRTLKINEISRNIEIEYMNKILPSTDVVTAEYVAMAINNTPPQEMPPCIPSPTVSPHKNNARGTCVLAIITPRPLPSPPEGPVIITESAIRYSLRSESSLRHNVYTSMRGLPFRLAAVSIIHATHWADTVPVPGRGTLQPKAGQKWRKGLCFPTFMKRRLLQGSHTPKSAMHLNGLEQEIFL
jgi:hypothetical protein